MPRLSVSISFFFLAYFTTTLVESLLSLSFSLSLSLSLPTVAVTPYYAATTKGFTVRYSMLEPNREPFKHQMRPQSPSLTLFFLYFSCCCCCALVLVFFVFVFCSFLYFIDIWGT